MNSLGSGGCEGSRGSEVRGGEFVQEVLGLLEFLKVLGGGRQVNSSWRSMLPGGSEEEEPVDGRSGLSASRHPSPWATPLEVVVTIGQAVTWNLIFSDGMESGC